MLHSTTAFQGAQPIDHLTEDDDELGHECGIFSVIARKGCKRTSEDLIETVIKGIQFGSNRGRDGYGISVPTSTRPRNCTEIISYATSALSDIFRGAVFNLNPRYFVNFRSDTKASEIRSEEDRIKRVFEGRGGNLQGHIRYTTAGGFGPKNGQPMQNDPNGQLPIQRRFSFCFNGNIVNAPEIKEMLERESGIEFKTETDTEVLMRLIEYYDHQIEAEKGHGGKDSTHQPDYKEIYKRIDSHIEGGCVATHHALDGNVVAYSHGEGKRPLTVLQTFDGMLVIASETNQHTRLEGTPIDVQPGQILHYDPALDNSMLFKNGVNNAIHVDTVGENRQKFCPLEILYFMEATSKIGDVYVGEIRNDLGRALYKQERDNFQKLMQHAKEVGKDIVLAPIPNTAIPFAKGFIDAFKEDAQEYGVKVSHEQAIIRGNADRTFIARTQKERDEKARTKHAVQEYLVKDKIFVAIDDSLVRQTTINAVTYNALRAGAAEVHFLIGAPGILGPDTTGIALPDYHKLGLCRAASTLDEDQKAALYDRNASENIPPAIIDQMLINTADDLRRTASSLSFMTIETFLRALPENIRDKVSTAIFTGKPATYDSPAQQQYAQSKWDQRFTPS